MSETVHYTGKITLIKQPDNETMQQMAKRILNEIGHKIDPYFKENYLECISELESYELINDSLYKIEDLEYCDHVPDIFDANKSADGSISFRVQYYNGGCGFNEALEEAMSNLKN